MDKIFQKQRSENYFTKNRAPREKFNIYSLKVSISKVVYFSKSKVENATRLLSPESEWAIFLTSCRTGSNSKTQNLRKLGNFKKIPDMFRFDGDYPKSKFCYLH